MNKNKKILITGASGFIGFSLALNLLKKGHKILGYDSINDYYDVNLKFSRNKILKKKLIIKYLPKRNGDVGQIYASTKKFQKILKWKPKYNNINKIIKSAIKWEASC